MRADPMPRIGSNRPVWNDMKCSNRAEIWKASRFRSNSPHLRSSGISRIPLEFRATSTKPLRHNNSPSPNYRAELHLSARIPLRQCHCNRAEERSIPPEGNTTPLASDWGPFSVPPDNPTPTLQEETSNDQATNLPGRERPSKSNQATGLAFDVRRNTNVTTTTIGGHHIKPGTFGAFRASDGLDPWATIEVHALVNGETESGRTGRAQLRGGLNSVDARPGNRTTSTDRCHTSNAATS